MAAERPRHRSTVLGNVRARVASFAFDCAFHLLPGATGSHVVSTHQWRAVFCGAETSRPEVARAEIDGVWSRALEEVDCEFPQRRAVPARIRILCGNCSELGAALRLLGLPSVGDDRRGEYISEHHLIVIRQLHRADNWRISLAHELCHAFSHMLISAPLETPWADEGFAEVISSRVCGMQQCLLPRLRSWWHRGAVGQSSIGLHELLLAEYPVSHDLCRRGFFDLAALFGQFLHETRRTRPQGWAILRDALVGRLRPGERTIERFERHCGRALHELEGELAKFIQGRLG